MSLRTSMLNEAARLYREARLTTARADCYAPGSQRRHMYEIAERMIERAKRVEHLAARQMAAAYAGEN